MLRRQKKSAGSAASAGKGAPPRPFPLLRLAPIGDGTLICDFLDMADAGELRRVCRALREIVHNYPWRYCTLDKGLGESHRPRWPARLSGPWAPWGGRMAALARLYPRLQELQVTDGWAPWGVTPLQRREFRPPAQLVGLSFKGVGIARGALAALAGLRQLRELAVRDAEDPELSGAPFVLDLALLRDCRQLQKLSCNVAGDQLRLLAELPLVELDARGVDAVFGAAQVGALQRLEVLRLTDDFEFDAAPAAFARHLGRLRDLSLQGLDFHGGAVLFGAAHLRALALTSLSVQACAGARVTDEWFGALSGTGHVTLRGLEMDVTPAGLEHLSSMLSLSLQGVQVNDRALGGFRSTTRLVLRLCDLSGVTAAGLVLPPLRTLVVDDRAVYNLARATLPLVSVALLRTGGFNHEDDAADADEADADDAAADDVADDAADDAADADEPYADEPADAADEAEEAAADEPADEAEEPDADEPADEAEEAAADGPADEADADEAAADEDE